MRIRVTNRVNGTKKNRCGVPYNFHARLLYEFQGRQSPIQKNKKKYNPISLSDLYPCMQPRWPGKRGSMVFPSFSWTIPDHMLQDGEGTSTGRAPWKSTLSLCWGQGPLPQMPGPVNVGVCKGDLLLLLQVYRYLYSGNNLCSALHVLFIPFLIGLTIIGHYPRLPEETLKWCKYKCKHIIQNCRFTICHDE